MGDPAKPVRPVIDPAAVPALSGSSHPELLRPRVTGRAGSRRRERHARRASGKSPALL